LNIKGAGFGVAQKRQIEENINNAAFLRDPDRIIDELFAANEVSPEILDYFSCHKLKYKRTKH